MAQIVCAASYVGCVYNAANDNYYTGRNQSIGDYKSEAAVRVGQGFQNNHYYTQRGFIYFDTSGIPTDAIISAATINIHSLLLQDYSDTDFNIIIRGASSASNPVVLGDYDLTHYNGENLGELTTPSDYRNFTLNSNGFDYINKGGLTKFVLLSKEDIDNDPPTGLETVWYDSLLFQNYIKLTITYFEPTEPPTVETINEACEDRQSTTLTAVGEITGTGDGYTFRGFEYYQYDSEYDSSMYAVREIGRFVTPCIYRMTLSGLKPLTCYWIRAYAGNVFGISYGEWVICCTIAGSPSTYDVHTEPNTARYRLYVSDDEAIAWRGYKGPYSGKQTLINISDITNKTKGVKVLKVDLPDANTKGNFHICITVKQTLKG